MATEEEIKAFYNDLYAGTKEGDDFEKEDETKEDELPGLKETQMEEIGDVNVDLAQPANPKHPIPEEKLQDEPVEVLAYDQQGYESVDQSAGKKSKKTKERKSKEKTTSKKTKKATPGKTARKSKRV